MTTELNSKIVWCNAAGGPDTWYYPGGLAAGDFTADGGHNGVSDYQADRITCTVGGTITQASWYCRDEPSNATDYAIAIYDNAGTTLHESKVKGGAPSVGWNDITTFGTSVGNGTIVFVAIYCNCPTFAPGINAASNPGASSGKYWGSSSYSSFPYANLNGGTILYDSQYAVRVYVD